MFCEKFMPYCPCVHSLGHASACDCPCHSEARGATEPMSIHETGVPNAQPFYVCPNCFAALSTWQVHDQGTDACPQCGTAVRELAKMQIPAPATGTSLLCLLCATYQPWAIFDSSTGAAVCVSCRDASVAHRIKAQPHTQATQASKDTPS